MKKAAFTLLFAAFTWAGSILAQSEAFVPNQGQWGGSFDFRLQRSYQQVFFNADHLRLRLYQLKPKASAHDELPFGESPRGHVYEQRFLGANPKANFQTARPMPGYLNFLLGNNRQRWQKNVPRFAGLRYRDIYPGVDVYYYLQGDAFFKYDLVIHPRADPQQIRIDYQGVDTLGLLGEDLIIQTSVETLVESEPLAYQIIAGERKEIDCTYLLKDGIITYRLGTYDRSKKLIIDPTLRFSTYSGSTADNWGFTATPAADGAAYAAGIVFGAPGSQDYPVTLGAFQDTMSGGQIDVSISKVSPDGQNFIYSTYLGGTDNDAVFSSLETDDGALILLGNTASLDFPMLPTAHDTSFGFGPSNSLRQGGFFPVDSGMDMYLVILDSTGGGLNASTYLGGNDIDGKNQALHFNFGDEFRGDLAVDSVGNIIVACNTHSPDLPVSNTAWQNTPGGGQDGYVASFTADLRNLNWGSYVGGSSNDALFNISYTANNRLYIAGATESVDLNLKGISGYQPLPAGQVEGMLAEIDPQDGKLLNFTYTGTADDDLIYFVDADRDGFLYCLGQTYGNWPIVGQNLYQNRGSSQFLQRFSSNLSTCDRSTVFGSGRNDAVNISPTAMNIDECLRLSLAGFMARAGTRGRAVPRSSNQLPLFREYQSQTDGEDFYFIALDPTWERLIFASYFGDSASFDHVDGGTSRFRENGSMVHAVCAGCGGSSSFPTTDSAFSSVNNAFNCNLAVFEFDFDLQSVEAEVVLRPGSSDSSCIPYVANFVDSSFNTDILILYRPNGQIDTLSTGQVTITQPGYQELQFVAVDTTCNLVDSTTLRFYGLQPDLQADFEIRYDTCGNAGAETPVTLLDRSTDNSIAIWYSGKGDTLSGDSLVLPYGEGTFEITLVSLDTLCGNADTLRKSVVVAANQFDALLELESDPCLQPDSLRLVARYRGYNKLEWFLNGQLAARDRDSLILPVSANRANEVELVLRDSLCGAERRLSRSFFTYDTLFNLQFPNVFTPNGDGFNDIFRPLNEEVFSFTRNFSLRIYDRWGIELFSTQDIDEGWQGLVDGADAPETVYYYLVEYGDQCGRMNDLKGFVHLMR